MLLFLPCAIGVGIHGNIYEEYRLILLFFLGSVIMRSAGCIMNDFWDRNIDRKVERTKKRPLASNQITPLEALLLFITLSIFGLLILLQLSYKAILLGISVFPLIILYPLMKRITFWPQIFLGITFNSGILIAGMHIIGKITYVTIVAYLGCVIWTIYYDTIYAFMDTKDDKRIGVKSSAIFLEKKNYKSWLLSMGLSGVFLVNFALYLSDQSIHILLLCFLASITLVMWQITTLKINLTSNCFIRFKSNTYLGIIWAMSFLI
jgi:4-hydroxybenzoate polyprenyltransferase